jgi:hypothetical protein
MKFVIGLGKVIDLLCGRDSEVVRFPFTIEPHLWRNGSWVDVSLHSDTLFCFRANQSLLLFLNYALLAEKQQIPIIYSLV